MEPVANLHIGRIEEHLPLVGHGNDRDRRRYAVTSADGAGRRPPGVGRGSRAPGIRLTHAPRPRPPPNRCSPESQQPVTLLKHMQPVVEPAHHNAAHGRHVRDRQPLGLAAAQPAFDRLTDRQGLRHGELNCGIDIDAQVGRFFHRGKTRGGDGNFDLDIGRQTVETFRLLENPRAVPIVGRVGLDRDASFASSLTLVDGVQKLPRPGTPSPPSASRQPRARSTAGSQR